VANRGQPQLKRGQLGQWACPTISVSCGSRWPEWANDLAHLEHVTKLQLFVRQTDEPRFDFELSFVRSIGKREREDEQQFNWFGTFPSETLTDRDHADYAECGIE
jgi:hypothetical protein